MPKNDRYYESSTQWRKIDFFTVANYANKLSYDQIDIPHADMCFSNIIKVHSVY